jgi:hypothetical protein
MAARTYVPAAIRVPAAQPALKNRGPFTKNCREMFPRVLINDSDQG